MNEQLSLFEEASKTFWEKLQDLLNEIILSNGLPNKSLHIYSNKSVKGKNAGKEVSKSICIYEPEYPLIKDDVDNPGRNFVIMNIQDNPKNIELLIRISQYETIPIPTTAKIKSVASDTAFKHIIFSQTDNSIYDYIKENIFYCLKRYRSKERSFGCCSRFVACSDALKCVHENKLYATSCLYRKNLENGNIFYGENRNID